MTSFAGEINMISGFNEVRNKGLLLDFTIVIGDREFRVHRLVLAAFSEYFRAMLSHNLVENKTNTVTLEDIEPEIMESVLNFCYTGKLDLTSDNADEILRAASRFQMNSLIQTCCRYFDERLDDSTCLSVLSLARRTNLAGLATVAVTYCCANFKVIVSKPEFLLIDSETLEQILSDDRLVVDSELEVLDAIERWIGTDHEREQYLDNLLPLVRLALLDPITLVKSGHREILRKSLIGLELIFSAQSFQLLKNHPLELESVVESVNITPRLSVPGTGKEKCFYAIGGKLVHERDDYVNNFSDQVYKYDRISNKWTRERIQPIERSNFGCATMDGVIYIIGGRDDNDQCTQSCWRFDSKSHARWVRDVSSLEEPSEQLQALVFNGLVYALGGSTNSISKSHVFSFDPRTNIWSRCHDMLAPRQSFGATVHNGSIYVAGGFFSLQACNDHVLYLVERLNAAGEWERLAPMKYPRVEFSLVSCQGVLYAVGGRGGLHSTSIKHDTSEYYDEIENTWRLTSQMVHKYTATEAIVLDGLIYALGYFTEQSRNSSITSHVMESYDPATRVWTSVTSFPPNLRYFKLLRSDWS